MSKATIRDMRKTAGAIHVNGPGGLKTAQMVSGQSDPALTAKYDADPTDEVLLDNGAAAYDSSQVKQDVGASAMQ